MRRLRFEIEGVALRDMQLCRLGLVVLHPVPSFAGAHVLVKGPQGTQELSVPHSVTPQPIIDGIPIAMTEPFSELTLIQSGWGTLELSFTGELFELEDQRNWADASFKSYCTPLRLGFPRLIRKGARIAHTVELKFTPVVARTVRTGRLQRFVFPALGRGYFDSEIPSHSLAGVPWSHLQVGLPAMGGAPALRRALAATECGIELGIEEGVLDPEIVDLVGRHPARVQRILLSGPRAAPPSARALAAWRSALSSEGAHAIALFAATRGYFADLNRTLPLAGSPDGFAFPLSSTVHGDDPDTLINNVPAVLDIAETVRRHMPGSLVSLAPLALHYPARASLAPVPANLACAWLVAVLIRAAGAGVTAVTLSADVILAAGGGPEGRALPLFHQLIQCAGTVAMPVRSPRNTRVYALALSSSGGRCPRGLLAANLSTHEAQIKTKTDGEAIDLASGRSFAVTAGVLHLAPWMSAWLAG